MRGPLARGSREGALIVFSAVALYFTIALGSYHPADPGWSHSGHVDQVLNQGGRVGAWIADVFLYLFGYMAYLFPIMVAYSGWLLFRGAGSDARGPDLNHLAVRAAGFVLTLGTGCGLSTLHFRQVGALPLDAGGILGNLVGNNLIEVFSPLGGTLLLLALFLAGITLFANLSWILLMDNLGRYTLRLFKWVMRGYEALVQRYRERQLKKIREASASTARRVEVERKPPPRIESPIPAVAPSLRAERERQAPLFEPSADTAPLPELSLLDSPPPMRRTVSAAALEAMSRQVELKLADFDIEVNVVAVHPGPVVTRFELELAPGLKVSKVSNLAKDLARSLSTVSVRIVEVIPGKSVIGLEIPNEERELVCLSEILKSADYDSELSPLTLALGKDIGGNPVVVDLSRMPHLLVAGTTGAGKSVAINAMVLSMLYKATPADVRMIMIDPKMLELSVYEGIPHLLAPVVTDMKQASNALRWCVAEMERRYQVMSTLGVRNIGGYNRRIKEAKASGRPLRDPFFQALEGNIEEAPELEKLPLIVVFVDELADLMMVTSKKVEELIARLAQKARAAGIHLILATQRPSVDVITGLIKANIPCRIAFQVSSKVDSRTILDQMGAESLLG
ncbi:MAG TPA: DNA translocase FtsK 4TM domain-containing protein, partial [Gammaproteobacteria bacterium]|nr:DNA translocase FtsK 4TM domain-containing protein [Gammaproteobacteria bacterium]